MNSHDLIETARRLTADGAALPTQADLRRAISTAYYALFHHADKHHMVYRLNAVDAYERKLVKQIEVAAGVVADDHNRPYVRLVAARSKRSLIWVEVKVDVATPSDGVRRRILKLTDGDELEQKTRREAAFATALEQFTAVKVYAKLPRWFQVPTPFGPYNPDWAVLIQDDQGERLYLVVETKGSAFLDDLRNAERAKVECGKAHFKALQVGESTARYRVVHKADELLA